MLFSFISTVYNHESYIISHLESIRFQIVNFGAGYDFELVLCDDCSTDKTLDFANEWLDNNKHLFKVVKILTSETNEGIVENYLKGLNSFDGDFFHSLGGDDLYSCHSLLDCVELLNEFDIVQGAVLDFEQEKITTNLASATFVNFQSMKFNEIRHYARRGKFIFSAPGLLYKKQLITKKLLSFLSEFKMLEDSPLYYFLLKNENLKIYHYQIPIVLYRMSPSSISRNKNHPGCTDLKNDNVKFLSTLLGEANSSFRRTYIRNCILWAQSSKLRFLYRFNPISLVDRGKRSVRNVKCRKILKSYKENLTHSIRKNEMHILRCSDKSTLGQHR